MSKRTVSLLFLGGLLVAGFPSLGQTIAPNKAYTDSVEALIKETPSDTDKAALLNNLSQYWFRKDAHKALGFAQGSLALSRGNVYYTALARYYIGDVYYLSAPKQAKKEFQTVINLLKGDSSKRALSLLSRAWKNYGAVTQKVKGDNKAMMEILIHHSIPLAQQANDKIRMAEDYGALALIYSNLLIYNKAISYYTKAIKNGKDVLKKSPNTLATFYTRLAEDYLKDKQFKAAKRYLDSAKNFLRSPPPSIYQVIFI